MSWAANRVATRTEDIAYSLLGLFDVNLPLLYGEGKNAFRRLQEAIIKKHNDLTVLAFDDNDRPYMDALGRKQQLIAVKRKYIHQLAEHPNQFAAYNGLEDKTYTRTVTRLELAGQQLELETNVAKITSNVYAAFIAHRGKSVIAVLLEYDKYQKIYHRLPSPAKLFENSDPVESNLGLWIPPRGMTDSGLPRRKLVISSAWHTSERKRVHSVELLSYSFDISRFDIFEWGKLPQGGRIGVLWTMLWWLGRRRSGVYLAPGARFGRRNEKIVCVDLPGPGKYAPVCNVVFKANARDLYLGHLAVEVNSAGEVSPICIIIDSLYQRNNYDGDPARGRPTYQQIVMMTIDYENLEPQQILRPEMSSVSGWLSMSASSHRSGNSIQSSWIYLGPPADRGSGYDHFFMHKLFTHAGRKVGMSMGHVQIQTYISLIARGPIGYCEVQGTGRPLPCQYDVCWKLSIDEMTDGHHVAKQRQLLAEESDILTVYDVLKWSFTACVAFRLIEWSWSHVYLRIALVPGIIKLAITVLAYTTTPIL